MADAPTVPRRAELAAFLRARRFALQPETVGLVRGERRHTPGLRREEVAELAGIGVGWYTWLEQGRPINVSADVLARLARALLLNTEESQYVLRLAAKLPAGARFAAPADVPPDVRSMLDDFAGPATVLNARLDHLAWNTVSARIYGWDAASEPLAHNLLWRIFCEPSMARILVNWEEAAQNVVGIFRTMYVQHDPAFYGDLFAELTVSPDFRRMWSATNVGRPPSAALHVRLPDGRTFALNSMRLIQPELSGLAIFVQAPADDAARAVLRSLRAPEGSPSRIGR